MDRQKQVYKQVWQESVMICVYKKTKDYTVEALYQHKNGGALISWAGVIGRHFDTFQDMYTDILRICTENNIQLHKWTDFEHDIFDILFIDQSKPTKMGTYAYDPSIKD